MLPARWSTPPCRNIPVTRVSSACPAASIEVEPAAATLAGVIPDRIPKETRLPSPTRQACRGRIPMDIVKQEIQIADGSQKMPCHLAHPASGGPYPGVIVIMEAFGLNDNIRAITDRFAADGFVAI